MLQSKQIISGYYREHVAFYILYLAVHAVKSRQVRHDTLLVQLVQHKVLHIQETRYAKLLLGYTERVLKVLLCVLRDQPLWMVGVRGG